MNKGRASKRVHIWSASQTWLFSIVPLPEQTGPMSASESMIKQGFFFPIYASPKKSYYLNESHENTFSVVFYRVCSFTSGAGFPSKWGLGLLRACFPLSSFPHSHSQWSIRCSASRPFKTKQHQGICFQHCQCKCQDSAPRTLNKYS